VLPKILALRDTTNAAVEDVVKKWARRKPQKLRQIGLNYDLAHAKGFCENWEKMNETGPEEKQPKEKKQKRWRRRSRGENDATDTATPPPLSPATMSDAGEASNKDPYPSDDDLYAPSSDPRTIPWNAVCIIGLRVYSKDPEVSIKLVRPQYAEEGAALPVDGIIPAGATM
jgi:hypothetical protein